MAKRRKSNKPNATGRNPNGRFVHLGYKILNTNAYRALSCNARALLIELVMLHNGENNGSLYLSVRDAADRIGVVDLQTTTKAFDELIDLGFIQMTADAHFQVKASERSRARCWRLTWLAGPGRKLPSWEFLERQPEPKTKAHKRMERGNKVLKSYRKARDRGQLPVLDSNTMTHIPPELGAEAVWDSHTLNASNDDFPPNHDVRNSHTHIATPGGVGKRRA